MNVDVAKLKSLFGEIIYNRYIMDAYKVQLCYNDLRKMQDNDLDELFLSIQLLESKQCDLTKIKQL